jgi:transcriptional regulator with XRE-family HTH domain
VIDAQHLRALRIDRGLSQRKLAASAGVDALTIKRLEGGADPDDVTLRVLGKLAGALGVRSADLLAHTRNEIPANAIDAVGTIGSALAAGGRSTRTGLSRTAAIAPEEVDEVLAHLAVRLEPLGIAVARHGDEVWLAPQTAAAATGERHRPLDVNQARLLRRIHRGEDVRRSLTRAERTLTLPSLLRLGLVVHTDSGLQLSPAASKGFATEMNTTAALCGSRDA